MQIDQLDLMCIHNELTKEARTNHIKLDSSEHAGKCEGLPYNLDFIVFNKRAQIKCPHCGSANTARYLYGFQVLDDRTRAKLQENKIVLGGCEIEEGKNLPMRKCNTCGKNFGFVPLLRNRKTNELDEIPDIITSLSFSVGGYFEGFTTIIISKTQKGALVRVEKTFSEELSPKEYQISRRKWQGILNKLYYRIYLNEWKKRYDSDILDGTQWELEISMTNRRTRFYSGNNNYPPYWKELCKIFGQFSRL